MENFYDRPGAQKKGIIEANHFREVLAGPDGLEPLQQGIEVDEDGGIGFKDVFGNYKSLVPSQKFINFRFIEKLPPEVSGPELHLQAKVGDTWVSIHQWGLPGQDSGWD